MRNRTWWVPYGLVMLGAFVTTTAQADINVGVILSLTGPGASLGIPAKQSVLLWPKEIAGQKLNVTILDDTSDPSAAAIAAHKLVSEYHVDVLVGPSITPTALAAVQVAGETETPVITLAGSDALVLPADGPRRWAFKLPPSENIPLKLVFDTMKKKGEMRLAIIAVSNAYGQTFLDVAQKMAPSAGIDIVDVERFAATDTSFVAQALKIMASKPDAVFIAAAGTPALMPQLEVTNRGFSGTTFQTQAVANADYLRIGGTAINGTLLPVAPVLVAKQLDSANVIKPVALHYVTTFEGANGVSSRSLFAALAWDGYLLLDHAVPIAMKSAAPGTPAFRSALRDALEQAKNVVLTEGVYSTSATDHNGADARSQVMVRVDGGKWHLE